MRVVMEEGEQQDDADDADRPTAEAGDGGDILQGRPARQRRSPGSGPGRANDTA